jgi:phosphatidylserine/phosphatidylglycerophosphate/cardiolipin synthase-like enzyme
MKKILLLLSLLLTTQAFSQTSITVGFSRGQPSAKEVVMQAIDDANDSLYLAAYQYTNKDIIQRIIASKQRGVKVFVLLDRTQKNGDAQAEMVTSGIECRVDQRFRIMHHKFIIIDGQHIETGSFNYSANADQVNAENALYLKDVPDIAKKYKEQWNTIYQNAIPCPGRVS